MSRILFPLGIERTVHGFRVEKKDDQRVYVSSVYVSKWGFKVSAVPGGCGDSGISSPVLCHVVRHVIFSRLVVIVRHLVIPLSRGNF